MICDLMSDHSFDHLQVRTTWELWTLRHEKARFSDKKAPKSTQNDTKNRCSFVWELDAAGSSPVTSTTYCVENNPNILLLGEAFGLFVLFEHPNFNSKK